MNGARTNWNFDQGPPDRSSRAGRRPTNPRNMSSSAATSAAWPSTVHESSCTTWNSDIGRR